MYTIDKLSKKDREDKIQSGPSLLLESSLQCNNPSKDLHFLFESQTTTENPIATSKGPSTEMLASTGFPILPVRRAVHKPVSTNNGVLQRDKPSNKRSNNYLIINIIIIKSIVYTVLPTGKYPQLLMNQPF